MKLQLDKQQLSFLAECIREEFIERQSGLVESVIIANFMEKDDYEIVKEFLEQGEDNASDIARKLAYKDVTNDIVRETFTSFENTIIDSERSINDFMIRMIARLEDIPIIGKYAPIKTKLPAHDPLKIRFTLKDVPEAYRNAMEQRIESRRNMKYLASEVIGAVEDTDYKRAKSNMKTYLHASKYRTIRMIDTMIVAARKKYTGYAGSRYSRAALLRRMGAYSELAHALYNVLIILIGIIFTVAMIPVIKMIYIVVKKILRSLVNFISKPVGKLVGLVSSGISFLYRILRKIKLTDRRKNSLVKQGKNIIKHASNAKEMTKDAIKTVDEMVIHLKKKYQEKKEIKKKE